MMMMMQNHHDDDDAKLWEKNSGRTLYCKKGRAMKARIRAKTVRVFEEVLCSVTSARAG